MAAKFENTVTLNAQIPALVEKMRNIAFSGLGITLQSEAPYANGGVCFQLKNGMGLTSWGENISVILVPAGETQTTAAVRSECALPTQIIDWGKNKENVTKLIQFLSF